MLSYFCAFISWWPPKNLVPQRPPFLCFGSILLSFKAQPWDLLFPERPFSDYHLGSCSLWSVTLVTLGT